MRFRLESVRYIPAQLEPGVLYVSREFEIAVHLCACGCGTKIRTPLGATEWSVKKTKNGPILDPSVGNWQEPCRSHYWIHRGKVKWADGWSQEQIAAGRRREEQRRAAYLETRERDGVFHRFSYWVRSLLRRR